MANTILSDIEEAFRQKLTASGISFEMIALMDDFTAVKTPAANVAIVAGSFKRATLGSFDMPLTIKVVVVFSHLRNEQYRRLGINPLITGVVSLFAGRKLTLDREDGAGPQELPTSRISPVRFEQVYQQGATIAYTVEFNTVATIDVVDDDDTATALMKIGVDYFLKPGDAVSDAQDLVTL